MRILAIVLFSLLVAGSSAFAQTETAPDSTILVEVWVANDFRSIIIAAAGWEDSCGVSGYGRFSWRKNPKGSIEFSFPVYNKSDRKAIEEYSPGSGYENYPICCLVFGNFRPIPSIYPLEFFPIGSGKARETSDGVSCWYIRFCLEGEDAEIFRLSSNLLSPLAGSRPQ